MGHLAVAGVHVFSLRVEDALAEFEAALSLHPNFLLAQAYYGLVLSWVGRWQDGADAAFVGGNFPDAMRLARESIRRRPDFVSAHRVLTVAAAMPARTTWPQPRCRSCAACSPTSRSPGSPNICRCERGSGRIF
jgi:hypothetical protein